MLSHESCDNSLPTAVLIFEDRDAVRRFHSSLKPGETADKFASIVKRYRRENASGGVLIPLRIDLANAEVERLVLETPTMYVETQSVLHILTSPDAANALLTTFTSPTDTAAAPLPHITARDLECFALRARFQPLPRASRAQTDRDHDLVTSPPTDIHSVDVQGDDDVDETDPRTISRTFSRTPRTSAYRHVDPYSVPRRAPHQDYLVEHMLYPGRITTIGAWMGVGKTALVMAVIAALITQDRALGLLPVGEMNGRIVLVSELSDDEIAATVDAMAENYEILEDDVQRHLRVVAIEGESILRQAVRREFDRECQGAQVIIIDTFDRFAGINPNVTEEVLRAFAALKPALNRRSSVVLLDHQGKAVAGQNHRQSAVAGASAKQRDAALVLRLDRENEAVDDGPRLLRIVKDRFRVGRNLRLSLEEGRLVGSFVGNSVEHLKIARAKQFILEYLMIHGSSVRRDMIEPANQQGITEATFARAVLELKEEGRLVSEAGRYILIDDAGQGHTT